jgi:hypothetical protein
MSEQLNQWLSQRAQLKGLQACGLRHPDQTTFTEVRELEFTREALENAWRCVADLLQVARHQGCPAAYVRWSFDQSNLYCLARPDGTCLMAFTAAKANELDTTGLQAMFEEFQQLGPGHPGPAPAAAGPDGG